MIFGRMVHDADRYPLPLLHVSATDGASELQLIMSVSLLAHRCSGGDEHLANSGTKREHSPLKAQVMTLGGA